MGHYLPQEPEDFADLDQKNLVFRHHHCPGQTHQE